MTLRLIIRMPPLAAGFLVLLAACGGSAGYCEGQGHTPGSAAFDQCMAAEQANIDHQRAIKYRP